MNDEGKNWKKYSDSDELCANFIQDARMYPELNCEIYDDIRGLVQSPCGKISVIMTLGGEGVLVHDVMQLHC